MDKVGIRRMLVYTKQMVERCVEDGIFDTPDKAKCASKLIEEHINKALPSSMLKSFKVNQVTMRENDTLEVQMSFAPVQPIQHIQMSVVCDKPFVIQQLELPLEES